MRVGLWVRKTEGNRSLVIYRPKWEGSTENVMRNRMAAPGLVYLTQDKHEWRPTVNTVMKNLTFR